MMRLSDRAFVIDKLAEKLKHGHDPANQNSVRYYLNGFRYYLELSSEPFVEDNDEIGARIRQFHTDRGCCDGTDAMKCPMVADAMTVKKGRQKEPGEFDGTEDVG